MHVAELSIIRSLRIYERRMLGILHQLWSPASVVFGITLLLALYVPAFACTTNERDSGRYDYLLF